MPKKINISIPTSCHENWQDMTVADKGRFCASCQKHVIDFTTSSDRQIAEAFRKESNICGRLLLTQLHRDLVIPKEKSNLWMAASAAVVAFFTLGNYKAFAQNVKPETTQAEKNNGITSTVTSVNKRIIKGTVIDEAGIPIPGVTITNKISGKEIDIDFDGNFTVEANKGDVIEVSFIGMIPQEIIVDDNKVINIIMQEDSRYISTGFIVVGKNRTFFGRIFHSIGNIFR